MRFSLILFLGLSFLLAACDANPPSTIAYSELPATGDPLRGETLFNETNARWTPCASCHVQTANAAPVLDGYGQRAGSVVPEQDAREYTFYSIVEPGRYLTEGFGNAMPNHYDELMQPQDIADLIAYLLDL